MMMEHRPYTISFLKDALLMLWARQRSKEIRELSDVGCDPASLVAR